MKKQVKPTASAPEVSTSTPVQQSPIVDASTLEEGVTVNIKVRKLKDGTTDYKVKKLKASSSIPPSAAKPPAPVVHPVATELRVSTRPNETYSTVISGLIVLALLSLFGMAFVQRHMIKDLITSTSNQPELLSQAVQRQMKESVIVVGGNIVSSVVIDGNKTREKIVCLTKVLQDESLAVTEKFDALGKRMDGLANKVYENGKEQARINSAFLESEVGRVKAEEEREEEARKLAESTRKVEPPPPPTPSPTGYHSLKVKMGGMPSMGFKEQVVRKGQRSDWVSEKKVRQGMLYFSGTNGVMVVMNIGFNYDYRIVPLESIETDADGNLLLPNNVKKVSFTTYHDSPFKVWIQK